MCHYRQEAGSTGSVPEGAATLLPGVKMIEDCPRTDIEFDLPGLIIAHKHRSPECYCSRATLDDLLSDEVMAPVLRSAGYQADEFRELMAEMAWNLVPP